MMQEVWSEDIFFEKEVVGYVVGVKRPGDDPDEAVEEEILSVAPSHITYFTSWTHGPKGDTVDSMESGLETAA